jgi:hypothetical protein
MATCIVLIGQPQNENLQIKVAGRTHPDCKDFWDGNWLNCEVAISSGSFTGNFFPSIRANELSKLLDEIEPLYETLQGTVRFQTMEEQVEIEISGDGKGHIHAKGYLADDVNPSKCNKLNFNLYFDQTCLTETIKGLKTLLNVYPVLGT